jgi:hypothetical protein
MIQSFIYKTYATRRIFVKNGLINRRRKIQAVHYHPNINPEKSIGSGPPVSRSPFRYGHNSIAYIGTCPSAV